MNKLITPQQAGEMLCISEMTLRKWRWEGKGPKFVKMGSKVVYKQSDLCDFIEAQTRCSTSDTGETLLCNR